jgi:hypothetical protein
VGRFGSRFGRWGYGTRDARWSDRHAVAEVVRVPLDRATAVVDALAPYGIVATALPPPGPDAYATTAAIVVLAGEVDRAYEVLRRAGLVQES